MVLRMEPIGSAFKRALLYIYIYIYIYINRAKGVGSLNSASSPPWLPYPPIPQIPPQYPSCWFFVTSDFCEIRQRGKNIFSRFTLLVRHLKLPSTPKDAPRSGSMDSPSFRINCHGRAELWPIPMFYHPIEGNFSDPPKLLFYINKTISYFI